MTLSPPTINAWPPAPLPLPRYRRRRYTLSGEGHTQVLVGEPVEQTSVPTGETCLRLAEVVVDDPAAILAFVNDVGTAGFGGGPEEETVAEFVLGATVVRDAVAAWRLLTTEPDVKGSPWQLMRLSTVQSEQLPSAAADYLTDVIGSGLGTVTPTLTVRLDPSVEEPPTELNLHALCCLELFNHVATNTDFLRCANETCRRLFARDERGRRRGMRYCTRTCARAQAQRDFRRRRATGAQQPDSSGAS
jgi:hypothetical protein